MRCAHAATKSAFSALRVLLQNAFPPLGCDVGDHWAGKDQCLPSRIVGSYLLKRPLSDAFLMLLRSPGKRESICKAEVTSCLSLGFWLMCWLIISIVAMFIEACPEPVEGPLAVGMMYESPSVKLP